MGLKIIASRSLNGITCLLSVMKIYQSFQKLLVGEHTDKLVIL
jgi:hypothetical protein